MHLQNPKFEMHFFLGLLHGSIFNHFKKEYNIRKYLVFIVNPVGWPKGWPGWSTRAGWSQKWVNLFGQPKERSTHSVNPFGQPIRSTQKKVNPFGQPKKRSTFPVNPKKGQPIRSTQKRVNPKNGQPKKRSTQKKNQPIRSTQKKINPFGQPKKRSTHSVNPEKGQP